MKSFLSVGPKGRYWLNDLGRHMFKVGSENTKNWKFLIKKAELLFSTAESLNSLTKFPDNADEIWRSFVGLDDISVRLWPDKSVDLVKAFSPMHENLLARCTNSMRCLDCFVYLMSKEISNEIRLQSLGVVSSAMTGKRLGRFFHSKDSISLLCSYLDRIWENNKPELLSNNEHVNLFQELLSYPVKAKEKRALELSRLLSQTPHT